MKKLLFLLILLVSSYSFSQDDPIAAMPTKHNKTLIIDLMVVSKFDVYFTEYCTNRIEFLGRERGISKDKIDKYKSRISFPDFLDFTVFNMFAKFTTEELNEMINLSKKLNSRNNYSGVFFSTTGLELNIENRIVEYMKD